MKRLLLGSALSLAMLAGASAADLRPIYTKAPAYAPAYSWTGCYIGGNVGGGWAQKDWDVAAPTTPVGAEIGTNNPSGVLGGGQVGCNYQTGSWVLGIQWDGDSVHANDTNADQLAVGLQDRSRITWLTSVTGRVGYTWDRFLGYVKGGGAWERDNYETFVTTTNAIFSTASETRSGWTVGVGGEYAFTNFLTGFVEYDYYDFGTRTNTFAIVGTTALNFADIREQQHVVKGGLNFKLPPFPW